METASPPDRPLRSDAQESRAALLLAARELVAERGIDALTVSGVAQRAGLNRSTAYQHFRSRDELIDAVGGTGIGDLALCNGEPVVVSSTARKTVVTVEINSGCPSGVDLNLIDAKKGVTETHTVPNGGVQFLTFELKGATLEIGPNTPEAGSYSAKVTVN